MMSHLAARLRELGVPFAANDNISAHVSPDDVAGIERDARAAVQHLLEALAIDADHNTEGTAARVARMLVREVFRGRYEPAPNVTSFPNVKRLDELYTVGPIAVRSACSHHLVPIMGECWIGVIPGERVIGLSKFARLVDWVMTRPQIQEEAAVQLADLLEELARPRGLAVVVKADHHCMRWRGVRDPSSSMTTSVMRGAFRELLAPREEFFSIIRGQGYDR